MGFSHCQKFLHKQEKWTSWIALAYDRFRVESRHRLLFGRMEEKEGHENEDRGEKKKKKEWPGFSAQFLRAV